MPKDEYERLINGITEECGEDDMNSEKAEVAWVLGLEEGSDEWEELMDI